MKIAVCEDDRGTREHIVSLIKEQNPDLEVTAFSSGEEMLKSNENFDISFLDVEMKELSGMDVARHIRQEQEEKGGIKSILVFVTAYGKYVYDAFDVSAFHYLTKPIDEEKFTSVLKRALKEAFAAEEQTSRYIFVKHSGMQQKLYVKDIYYMESANKKVIFHTGMGTVETYGKMEEWEQMLGNSFYRCHRCYLVNMENITSYGADTIQVVNGDKLILARKKYGDFVKQYMKYARDGGVVNV